MRWERLDSLDILGPEMIMKRDRVGKERLVPIDAGSSITDSELRNNPLIIIQVGPISYHSRTRIDEDMEPLINI